MHGHQRADGDEAELPQRDLARPPRQHGQAQGDDREDADLAEQKIVADREHERQQDCDADGQPDAGGRNPLTELVDPGPQGGGGTVLPRAAFSRPGAFAQGADAHQQNDHD